LLFAARKVYNHESTSGQPLARSWRALLARTAEGGCPDVSYSWGFTPMNPLARTFLIFLPTCNVTGWLKSTRATGSV